MTLTITLDKNRRSLPTGERQNRARRRQSAARAGFSRI